jgi:hypothetical protein
MQHCIVAYPREIRDHESWILELDTGHCKDMPPPVLWILAGSYGALLPEDCQICCAFHFELNMLKCQACCTHCERDFGHARSLNSARCTMIFFGLETVMHHAQS